MKHVRYYWLLLAEGHLPRRVFGAAASKDCGAGATGLGKVEQEFAKSKQKPTCSILTRQPKSRPVSFFKDLGSEDGNRGLNHRPGIACRIEVAWRMAGRKEFLESGMKLRVGAQIKESEAQGTHSEIRGEGLLAGSRFLPCSWNRQYVTLGVLLTGVLACDPRRLRSQRDD